MSLKKNFFWNLLLTASNYIFPLLTFPYVTRVLGAESLGSSNFALSIVDYAILFSTFGMSIVGIRNIAQNSTNPEKRNMVFNSLVSLHIIMSVVVLVAYFTCIYMVPSLSADKKLYWVGGGKIIANIFLVEWLFQGMQDFRYVTIRSLLVRSLYVISVFLLVKKADDYDTFFYISIGQVILNAIVNWNYARRYIKFRLSLRSIGTYLYPVFSMGINNILLSIYTTFNVLYLGFACDKESVGYFTAAVKLYTLFISVITAYNSVFVPYLNTLYANKELGKFIDYVTKSVKVISLVSVPFVISCITLAPEIIRIIAGAGYGRSVLPFRIITIQILFVGLTQVFENQVLLSFNKLKEILVATSSTTVMSVLIIVLFVKKYAEIAAAVAVAVPHFFELIVLFYFSKKTIPIKFPAKSILINVIACLPIIPAVYYLRQFLTNNMLVICISGVGFILYYFVIQYLVIKDPYVVTQYNKLRSWISHNKV